MDKCNAAPQIARQLDACAPQPAASRFSEILINKVANGFIVRVGCSTFVALDWKYVATGLGEYFNDPKAAAGKYCKP
jgi:hypothetical protein